jgi:uncharacterized protein (DUF2235 family)
MKHLVSLIDGTWLTPNHIAAGYTHSNIYEINLLLSDEYATDKKNQIVFYSRGLGAVAGLRKFTAGGFAFGIKEEIEDVYINIASNYVRGPTNRESDKIYLYGFSRGAVVARVVAGLISNIGLLYPWEIERFGEIWKLYKEQKVFTDGNRPEHCQPRADIEFLGVFDTVFGGNSNDRELAKRLQFAGRKLSRNVKNAFHILAIDEQRPFFRPLLWEDSDDHGGLHQVWMPGVHGDIGGIYGSEFLGQMSLLTMIEATQARTTLAFDEERLESIRVAARQTFLKKNVSISTEWSAFWRFASLYQKHVREPSTAGSRQFLHFVCSQLKNADVHWRKNRRRYSVREAFSKLEPKPIPAYYRWDWESL